MKINPIQFLNLSPKVSAPRSYTAPLNQLSYDSFTKSSPTFTAYYFSAKPVFFSDGSVIRDCNENSEPFINTSGSTEKILYSPENKAKGHIFYHVDETLPAYNGLPEYYLAPTFKNRPFRQCLDVLYVSELEAYDKHEGVGTKLIQKAVKDSFAANLEGRVILNASGLDYSSSPIEFYHKLGFRCVNPLFEQTVCDELDKGNKLPVTWSTIMYLPQENVRHLLSYKK